MAAGDAFSLTPNKVSPHEPLYHNVITASESQKKEYLNMSATPILRYTLKFNVLSLTDMQTLRDHYKDQSGGYYLFSWQSVPTYIDSGANISGRWVDKSFKRTPAGKNQWMCEIKFEKDNG